MPGVTANEESLRGRLQGGVAWGDVRAAISRRYIPPPSRSDEFEAGQNHRDIFPATCCPGGLLFECPGRGKLKYKMCSYVALAVPYTINRFSCVTGQCVVVARRSVLRFPARRGPSAVCAEMWCWWVSTSRVHHTALALKGWL